jgi:predicted acylesterase/phospholipase RssA
MRRPRQKADRQKADRQKADTLVLSSGGVKGVAMLGTLHALHTVGELSQVRTVVGTSVGALVGALVATRRDLHRALDTIAQHGYAPDFDFSRLFKEYGLDSGKCIESLFTAMVGPDNARATFADIHRRHGIKLYVCATNLTTRHAEFFGPDDHGDMPVALAVRMSCSVPLLFSAVRYRDALYVDGALVNNFPCDWAYSHGAKKVLGITVKPERSAIVSFEGFIGAVVESAASGMPSSSADVLELDVQGVFGLNFAAPRPELERLFGLGADLATSFLKKRA